jgi:hypothetical protein
MSEKRAIPIFKWSAAIVVMCVLFFAHGFISAYQTRANIRFVILKDSNIDNEFNDAVDKIDLSSDDGFNTLVEDVNVRVEAEKKIPTQNCPTDFVDAYNHYLDAWENVANIVASHPHAESGMETIAINFLRGMAMDFTGPERDQKAWTDWQTKFRESMSLVQQARSDVDAKAAQHGVR